MQIIGNIQSLISKAVTAVETFLNERSASASKIHKKQAVLFSYWLPNYVKFLRKEDKFDCNHLKKYKKGDVLKVDFGYRIGSEQGGLHYAVVLDNANSIKSSIVTVIPLGSEDVNSGKTSHYNVKLGTVIYDKLRSKQEALFNEIAEKIKTAKTEDSKQALRIKAQELLASNKEIDRLKYGSIALVAQITTISKIRIVNPIHSRQSLHGIRLTPLELSLIENKLKTIFLYSDNN